MGKPVEVTNPLNAAVRLISVFRSWEHMREDIARTGYIPTLRTDDAAAPTEKHKESIRLVRRAVREAGFPYYDGERLVKPMTPLCDVGGCWESREPQSRYCALGASHAGAVK